MSTTRKHCTGTQKVAILRRHLIEHIPISDVCDQYGYSVSMFNSWQNQFFQNGAVAFKYDRPTPLKHQDGLLPAQVLSASTSKARLLKNPRLSLHRRRPARGSV
jgi:hypothetical protein